MSRKPSAHPTEFELEILKVLWSRSPLLVSEIRDALAKQGRDSAHTSVITILNIMVDKGYLDKQKNGKSYKFWPTVTENFVSQKMLGDIVDRVFDGSAQRLMLNLLESDDCDQEVLLDLRKLINQTLRAKKAEGEQ